MQTVLANNRQARRKIHIRPNLTIMKGTIADLKFVRYGDMVIPIIMGNERKRIINHIVPQGLNQYVSDLVTVLLNASQAYINGWNSVSPGNTILLINNGFTVQTLNATVIPVLNGSTVIWIFIASDLSSSSYTANQVNLFITVNFSNSAPVYVHYSPAFLFATATANIVKQSGEAISFVWEIQLNLGSNALPDFIYGILYSIPVVSSCGGKVGTFGGVTGVSVSSPYSFSSIELQYVGGSISGNISSINVTYDGTNTYLVVSASISLSSQVTVTSVVINVSGSNFCINGTTANSGSAIQIPYSATLPPGTVTVTVTIEFSPAT